MTKQMNDIRLKYAKINEINKNVLTLLELKKTCDYWYSKNINMLTLSYFLIYLYDTTYEKNPLIFALICKVSEYKEYCQCIDHNINNPKKFLSWFPQMCKTSSMELVRARNEIDKMLIKLDKEK
jgi:hypothetical protein